MKNPQRGAKEKECHLIYALTLVLLSVSEKWQEIGPYQMF